MLDEAVEQGASGSLISSSCGTSQGCTSLRFMAPSVCFAASSPEQVFQHLQTLGCVMNNERVARYAVILGKLPEILHLMD